MLRVATILLAVSLLACAGSQHRSTAVPLPALELAQLDGGTWTPSVARDRVLVIDVWASWCEPCRKGFPLLAELAGKRPDIVFLAVSIDEEIADVHRFLSEQSVGIPIALDPGQTLMKPPLEVRRVPTILVIDRQGVVRHRLQEPSAADYRRLETLIDAL